MEKLRVLLFESDKTLLKLLEKQVKSIIPKSQIILTESWDAFCECLKMNNADIVITSKSASPNIITNLSQLISSIKEDDRPLGTLVLTDDHVEELNQFIKSKLEYLKRNGETQFKVQMRQRTHFPTFGELSIDASIKEIDGDFEENLKVENISVGGIGVKSNQLKNNDFIGKHFRVDLYLPGHNMITIICVQKHTGSMKKSFPGFQFTDLSVEAKRELINFIKNL